MRNDPVVGVYKPDKRIEEVFHSNHWKDVIVQKFTINVKKEKVLGKAKIVLGIKYQIVPKEGMICKKKKPFEQLQLLMQHMVIEH